jgi:predicted transposase/invertase (TIGR01784 family)
LSLVSLVRGVAMLNPFVAQNYAEGKVPILDIRARDDLGRQFVVEMQLLLRAALAKRLLYYGAGAHAEQLLRGERYELLLPTYVICFLNETMFDDPVYHHRFQMYDAEQRLLLCKDLQIHVIELSKFDLPVEAVQTPLERWCYFFKHGTSLDLNQLPATLDVPPIRKALEVLVKLSQNEIERHRAAERLRAERDAADLVAEAKASRQEGFQKGIAKGKLVGRIQLLQQLLQQPEMSSEELGQQSEQDLQQLEERLNRQFRGSKPANGSPPSANA